MHTVIQDFIERIPKTDLHVHLDGSLRLTSLIDMAREDGVELPSNTPDGLEELVFKDHYRDLPDYLRGFAYTCAVLQNSEHLERTAFELAEDNIKENVRYMEVRFAPQLHIHDEMELADIVRAVARGMDKAKKTHNNSPAVRAGKDLPFEYGLILCAMRHFNEHYSSYFAQLIKTRKYSPLKETAASASLEAVRAAVYLAREEGLPVTGFDLAGEEAGYPAIEHREAYQYAHRHFLKKTVHAGEAYGPESIFQAITECYANRIGHGTFLFASDMIKNPAISNPETFVFQLAEYIASERIAIEVCPTSNLQTIPFIQKMSRHPLRQMLEHNLSVSICTDNRLVSKTTVTDELLLVIQHLPVTARRLRNLILSGFKGSFYPGTYNEKRAYVRNVIDRYDELAKSCLKQSLLNGDDLLLTND